MYLGAAFNGSRMNVLFRSAVPTAELIPLVRALLRRYAQERNPGERFGDFSIRAGLVNPTGKAADFHDHPDDAGRRHGCPAKPRFQTLRNAKPPLLVRRIGRSGGKHRRHRRTSRGFDKITTIQSKCPLREACAVER